MADLEDWDIDENFLKDIEDKAVAIYSQHENDAQLLPKRHKLDLDANVFSSDLQTSIKKNRDSIKKLSGQIDGASRKNFILESLRGSQKQPSNNNTEISINEAKFKEKKDLSQKNLNNKHHNNHSQSRKQFVCNVLEKKCIKSMVNKNKDESSENVTKTITTKDNTSENKFPLEDQDLNFLNDSDLEGFSDWDTENILNCMQQGEKSVEGCSNAQNIVHGPINVEQQMAKKDSMKSIRNISQIQSMLSLQGQNEGPKQIFKQCNKVTVSRKFAGPAGLLPDISQKHPTIPFHLNNYDEECTSAKPTGESTVSCWSQNTKNLFTEGAWQLMWEDLPESIQKRLKQYEITMILQSARDDFLQNLKVEFFAGLLENLQNRNNLVHFTLKDSTGSIPAVVYSDISSKYPDIFCTNTVILLHNVTVTRMFQSTDYRFIITPSNILGMYTDKGKIIKTAKFNELLNSITPNNSTDQLNITNLL